MPHVKPIMGRAARGLYAGRHVAFGYSVSESGVRTRKKWEPNVQHKTIKSEVLGFRKRLAVTTHALRCIKKAGGLDQWLLTSKYVIDSTIGSQLKDKVLNKIKAGDAKMPTIQRRKLLVRPELIKVSDAFPSVPKTR